MSDEETMNDKTRLLGGVASWIAQLGSQVKSVSKELEDAMGAFNEMRHGLLIPPDVDRWTASIPTDFNTTGEQK